MNELSTDDVLRAIESGKIPIGFLYRHKLTSKDGTCEAGEWEWYEAGSPGRWHRGPTFKECVMHLMHRG